MEPEDPRSDAELLVAARFDPEAFGVFYRRHARGLVSFFRRRVESAELAFDLTAETMAATLAAVPRYEPRPEPARVWLYGIAQNKLSEARRSGGVQDRARRALAMQPIVVDDEAIERLESEAGTPALNLLSGLPVEQRDAIRARHLDERGGPIRSIDYRNGYVCRLHSPTSIRGTNTCPHVGEVPITRPRLRPADVASPVTVTIARGPRGKTLIVSFTARVAVTGASSEYSISLRYPGSEPRCGSRISGPLLGDVTSGRRQQFTEDTGGCRGTFRGTITYRYGQNTSGMPFDILGRALTVGTFEVTVR